jgi:hypothetical protein
MAKRLNLDKQSQIKKLHLIFNLTLIGVSFLYIKTRINTMRYLLTFFTSWIILYSAYATPLPYKNLVFTFSGGPGWASPFQANIISTLHNPYQQVQLTYPNIQTVGMGEIFVSSENPFYKNIYGQFGGAISGAGATTSTVHRDLYHIKSQYKYQLTQYRVAFRGKLFTKSLYFNPYITSSVGAGFTELNPEKNTNSFAQISSVENTAYSLNHTFGVGIEHIINPQWTFSMGYEYYSWGKADTNLLPTLFKKTYNIQLPNLNILLFSLSYRNAS